MIFLRLFLLCSFFILNVLTAKVQINKLTTLCSRTDENLTDCATKSANEFLPQMVKGIRDYGLPPIDPLKIPFMQLSQSERAVGLKLNISDTTHEGMRDARFKSVRMNLEKNSIEADLFLPQYNIIGTCDVGGRILLLPIVGHGACNLTSINQDVEIRIKVKPEQRNNKKYFKVDKFVVSLRFKDGSFNLQGLFGGNPELGKAMNRFLNQNALEVLNEMKPTLELVWGDLYGDIAKRILSSVPIDQMLKP